MNKFLELNPLIPRDRLFVDANENFTAYKTAGFGNIGDTKVTSERMRTLKAPNLGASTWWKYLINVNKLSPIPKNLRFGELPEGVLRLGGTFAIDGDTVLFAHADQFPGDHPAITDVLRAVGVAVIDRDDDAAILLDDKVSVIS